jgi:tetratricopeptide (TPR) repeat protein
MKRSLVNLLVIVSLVALSLGLAAGSLSAGEDSASFYFNRGVGLYLKGQLDLAIADFSKALEIDPRMTQAYNNRGSAYDDQGQFNRAIADFTKALEIDPTYAQAYYNRGLAYARHGQIDRARADFNKAAALDPRYGQGNAVALNHLGVAWAKEGWLDFAISYFTKALEIDPRYAEAYDNRAKAYFVTKEFDNAWSDVRQAQRLGFKTEPAFLQALRQASGTEH